MKRYLITKLILITIYIHIKYSILGKLEKR